MRRWMEQVQNHRFSELPLSQQYHYHSAVSLFLFSALHKHQTLERDARLHSFIASESFLTRPTMIYLCLVLFFLFLPPPLHPTFTTLLPPLLLALPASVMIWLGFVIMQIHSFIFPLLDFFDVAGWFPLTEYENLENERWTIIVNPIFLIHLACLSFPFPPLSLSSLSSTSSSLFVCSPSPTFDYFY